MPLPAPEEIHLWFVFCDRIRDRTLLARYRELLSAQEREQEKRLLQPRGRHRYLLTRALVRTTLSRYAAVAPEDWLFASDEYGRPRILNERPDTADLSFNISHTEEVVLLGVANRYALGVDVEKVRRSTPVLQLAQRYFSAIETRGLHEQEAARQQQRFFEYWTLKESYIKARGLGLSIPLDQFSFHIADHELSLQIEPQSNDAADRWRLWLLRPCPEHLAAVCAERILPAQSLVARAVVPLHSEHAMTCELLARSPA